MRKYFNSFRPGQLFSFLLSVSLFLPLFQCSSSVDEAQKPRVIVSTDIGGTDPDDFQSMIHYLMYTDMFDTEGLIASPFGEGRKEHIHQIIDLYEKDLPALQEHSTFPEADELREVVKQGGIEKAPHKGWSEASEGSDWIIKKALEEDERPLWVLVWGGLEDVAQALHDAPEIASAIRIYWIGGPNKKWARNAYYYIAANFPDLWFIEANSTYRGWIIDDDQPEEFGKDAFYEKYIKGRGALGSDFGNYYGGTIKMGDTPSVAFLMNGDANDPEGESWGGSFRRLPYSGVRLYDRHTTALDSLPVYGLVEWTFRTGSEAGEADSAEIWMEIDRQRINGTYLGEGVYQVRFVPKGVKEWSYLVHCSSPELDGAGGGFTAYNAWPGEEHPHNLPLSNWWSDRTDEDLYLGQYQGARTVSMWRTAFLSDWAERLSWLQ